MVTPERNYAVITGDLVGSTKLTPDELSLARERFRDAIVVARRWNLGVKISELDFFRGDSWQLLVHDPTMALRLAVFLRVSLLSMSLADLLERKKFKADTRLSIGIGPVETISNDRVSLSQGEAFVLSGHNLDRLSGHSNMAIGVADGLDHANVEWLPVVVQLLDSLIGGWTTRQAETICLVLDPEPPQQDEIAKLLNTSQPAVSRSLLTAKWDAIERTIKHFKKLDWDSGKGS